MKSKFTLTKTFALAILLVPFTAVSAASFGDECKTKCCKNKKSKTVSVAIADLDKALEELKTEIRYVTAVAITKEGKNSLRIVRLKKVAVVPETPAVFFAFDIVEENTVDAKHKIDFNALDKEMNQVQEELSRLEENKVDATQKIDFTALDKEMNQVQEDLSKMDDGLKFDDVKNRKAAEEILKTGIKS